MTRNNTAFWDVTLAADDNIWDEVEDLAVDRDGNIFVAWRSRQNNNNWEFKLSRYSNNGVKHWESTIPDFYLRSGQQTSLSFNQDGNLYLSGSGFPQAIVIGIDPSLEGGGQEIWRVELDNQSFDSPWQQTAVDSSGNLVIANTVSGEITKFWHERYQDWREYKAHDIQISSINPNGAFNWQQTLATPSKDYAKQLILTEPGQIAVLSSEWLNFKTEDFYDGNADASEYERNHVITFLTEDDGAILDQSRIKYRPNEYNAPTRLELGKNKQLIARQEDRLFLLEAEQQPQQQDTVFASLENLEVITTTDDAIFQISEGVAYNSETFKLQKINPGYSSSWTQSFELPGAIPNNHMIMQFHADIAPDDSFVVAFEHGRSGVHNSRDIIIGKYETPSSPDILIDATAYASVQEGDNIKAAITTQYNDTLWWRLEGTGITQEDLVGGQLHGEWQSGELFNDYITNDLINEGDETLIINLYGDPDFQDRIGNQAGILIRDASIPLHPPFQQKALTTAARPVGSWELLQDQNIIDIELSEDNESLLAVSSKPEEFTASAITTGGELLWSTDEIPYAISETGDIIRRQLSIGRQGTEWYSSSEWGVLVENGPNALNGLAWLPISNEGEAVGNSFGIAYSDESYGNSIKFIGSYSHTNFDINILNYSSMHTPDITTTTLRGESPWRPPLDSNGNAVSTGQYPESPLNNFSLSPIDINTQVSAYDHKNSLLYLAGVKQNQSELTAQSEFLLSVKNLTSNSGQSLVNIIPSLKPLKPADYPNTTIKLTDMQYDPSNNILLYIGERHHQSTQGVTTEGFIGTYNLETSQNQGTSFLFPATNSAAAGGSMIKLVSLDREHILIAINKTSQEDTREQSGSLLLYNHKNNLVLEKPSAQQGLGPIKDLLVDSHGTAYIAGEGVTSIPNIIDQFNIPFLQKPNSLKFQEDLKFHRSKQTFTIPLIQASASSHEDSDESTAVGHGIHFNSLEYQLKEVNVRGEEPIKLPSVILDIDDLDNNPQTNAYIAIEPTQQSQVGQLDDDQKIVANLTFESLRSSSDAITGSHAGNTIGMSVLGNKPGQSIALGQATVKQQDFSLDINGDGVCSLYTDGIMIIRKLIGLEDCTQGFASETFDPDKGRRTAQEANAYLSKAMDDKSLDFNHDNTTSLYTDGILLIRYLIEPSLINSSQGLINNESLFHQHQSPYASTEAMKSYFDFLTTPTPL